MFEEEAQAQDGQSDPKESRRIIVRGSRERKLLATAVKVDLRRLRKSCWIIVIVEQAR